MRESDPTLHNVHAPAKLNREFNLAQPFEGMQVEKTFDQPEILVRLATLAIRESPFRHRDRGFSALRDRLLCQIPYENVKICPLLVSS